MDAADQGSATRGSRATCGSFILMLWFREAWGKRLSVQFKCILFVFVFFIVVVRQGLEDKFYLEI